MNHNEYGDVYGISATLIQGDPLDPDDCDVLCLIGLLKVDKPLPDGWSVLSGNMHHSQVGTVMLRYEFIERKGGEDV
jgi:hypothetical protein